MAQWKTNPFGNIESRTCYSSSLFGEFECEIGKHICAEKTATAEKTAFVEKKVTSKPANLKYELGKFLFRVLSSGRCSLFSYCLARW